MSVTQFIDGHSVTGDGAVMDNLNPTTGAVIEQWLAASPEQVLDAVGAARASFDGGAWSGSAIKDRQATLRRCAQAIRDDLEPLADLQVTEGGMPIKSARGQIMAGANWFDYYADFLTTEAGESYRQLGNATTLVTREPMGVCALFSPWNVPVALSAIKLAPALAAGNSVVLKPSEETPLVTRRLVELIHGTGLPRGVVNYVNGSGATTGAALAEAAVDAISFTGGAVGGRAVGEAAARRHVPCVMELGGKSATLVFEDADLDAALQNALIAAYGNNGQACIAGARLLLHSQIADAFLERFAAAAQSMVLGDPKLETVQIGPLISDAHRARVMGFYDSAAADGDTVLFGGPAEGFFMHPGAIEIASTKSRIWTEEVFGPLVAVTRFTDEAEAIDLANDSAFGLAGYLWTQDITRAMRIAKHVRTGTMTINAPFFPRDPNAPFGGFKASGIGREGGAHSWANFTQAKTTIIHHGDA